MQTKPTETPEYVEHISDAPLDCANTLSDDLLEAGGLVRVSAFMRTKSSANAARVKKARAKAADTGVRQLNVVVPLAAHAAMKAIAKDLQAGCVLGDVLRAALVLEANAQTTSAAAAAASAKAPSLVLQPEQPANLSPISLAPVRLAGLKGWRLFVARLMGLV